MRAFRYGGICSCGGIQQWKHLACERVLWLCMPNMIFECRYKFVYDCGWFVA